MSEARKKQQMIIMAGGTAVVLALGYLVFGVLGPSTAEVAAFPGTQDSIDVTIVADRTSAAAPEMSWVTQSRAEIENMKGLIENLQESLAAEQRGAEARMQELREEYDEVIVQQAQKIAALEAAGSSGGVGGSAGQAGVVPASANSGGAAQVPDYSDTGSEFIERRTAAPAAPRPPGPLLNGRQAVTPAGASEETPSAGGFGQEFTLAEVAAPSDGINRNTLRNYIPAGSYAPAVVLSGADAATNVVDRENPIPVLLRITGPAITAARGGGNGARVNIEGCTVQGSAIGDLSSERVRVRLLSLTCLGRGGTVIETEITGYMVGAGKEGVRGRVVSREGPLVGNAAIAGALQGLGSAFDVSDGADGLDSVDEIAQTAAAAAGAGSVETAASTLSEYYINRAEQYQPVISLNGGTPVEIVFLEGVALQ